MNPPVQAIFATNQQHEPAARDVADLRWYFRSGGLDVFRVSSFGAQLERASMFSHRVRTCPKCRSTGFVPANPRKWRKTSELERAQQRWLGKKARYLERPFADQTCPKCRGMGFVVSTRRQGRGGGGITAQPTGSSVRLAGGGVVVADDLLDRMGRVAGRLARARRVEPLVEPVFAAVYGPGSSRTAVWSLVPAGQKLLRTNPHELAPEQLFTNLLTAQRELPDPTRGRLLETAVEQSDELVRRAKAAWVGAVA